MENKLKCYVITISKNFPATHPRQGEKTGFSERIENNTKIHTIRGNYEFWKKRMNDIESGIAYLSVREWTGKPYASKQKELFRFHADDGVGCEKLEMTALGWFIEDYDTNYSNQDFANHDGLSIIDFIDWFKGKITIDMEPMAIIHFTEFRYHKNQ
jgi:hypothetical protein